MSDLLRTIMVGPEDTILDAVRAIDRGGKQIALVVDAQRRLVATVTDGDVRRGLLNGISLEAPVASVMRTQPTVVHRSEGREAALRLMRKLSIHQVPVVDTDGVVTDLEWIDDLVALERQDTCVVLMAGGLGERLRPLTEDVPKPMLPVGGRPLLESIIRDFADQGFGRFYVSVNYRREVVQDYFGDGSWLDVDIEYLVEKDRLGTAGALSLLPERPERPFIVMNGDLLTTMHFDSLLRFHSEQESTATMCARPYSVQVPYGVVRLEGARLTSIDEKPTHSYLVNVGIYALSPVALDYVKQEEALDMPDLFSRMMGAGCAATVFPIREFWMDVGQIEDLERARNEFETVFER